jgi:hypothetical protein
MFELNLLKSGTPPDEVAFLFCLTFWRLAQWRISEHKTVSLPQKLMRGRMFN